MRIVAIICLFLSVNAYSQNIYQVVKAGRKGLRVMRTITVSPRNMRLASRVISERAPNTKISANVKRAIITAEMRQPICHPTQLVGGYNYLRTTAKRFKSLPQWEKITKSGGYNGAHHIVTQTVIDAIAKEEGIKHVTEIKANAPAVYSPLHGNPMYTDLFHDHATLLKVYHEKGVRGLVLDFFERLNEAHKTEGLMLYDEETIRLELGEAELWSKTWGFKWE